MQNIYDKAESTPFLFLYKCKIYLYKYGDLLLRY